MGKGELVTEQPRCIKLNECDNVAIVVSAFQPVALCLRPRTARLRAAGSQDRVGRYRKRARRSRTLRCVPADFGPAGPFLKLSIKRSLG